VVWLSDDMMEVLNTTLIGSTDVDTFTFEVDRLHGLSTFSCSGPNPQCPQQVSIPLTCSFR
jgi:hypothetical protein